MMFILREKVVLNANYIIKSAISTILSKHAPSNLVSMQTFSYNDHKHIQALSLLLNIQYPGEFEHLNCVFQHLYLLYTFGGCAYVILQICFCTFYWLNTRDIGPTTRFTAPHVS